MRLLLFILGVFAAVVCIEKSAEANWCAHYNMGAVPAIAVSRHITNA
jgi:hypothetical protein